MPSKKRSRRPPARKSQPNRPRPQAAGRTARSAPAAASATGSFYTPGGSPFRRSVERTSAPLLVLMTQTPRYLVTVTPLALLLLGAFLPLPYAFVFLGLFLILTAWLAYLSWPGVTPGQRALRVGMLALVIAIAVFRVVHH